MTHDEDDVDAKIEAAIQALREEFEARIDSAEWGRALAESHDTRIYILEQKVDALEGKAE
jgi:hypothetical protein